MLVSALPRLACCAVLAGRLLLTVPAHAQPPPAPSGGAAPASPPAGVAGTPDPAATAPEAATPTPEAAAPVPQAAAPAADAPSPLSLTWNSTDPSCDGSAVGPRALELVSPLVVPNPTDARALVERDGERWRVQLETRSQSRMGQRTLRGESCKEIQQAISLLLAMIMEAEAKGESTPPPGPPPEPLSMLNPDEDPVVDTAPAALPQREWSFLVRGEGAVGVGLQPSLGLGLGASVGLSLGSFEAHLVGAYWPSSRASIFEREGALEMTREAVGASLCYRWLGSGRIELLSCVGPELLWMQWRTTGLLLNRAGGIRHLLTLSGSVELRLAAVGPVFVALTPGFTWQQRRPFQAERCDNCTPTGVFQTWDIGPRFGAGVGARF